MSETTVICKGCGKSYETSFGGYQNADLCKECFIKWTKGDLKIEKIYEQIGGPKR